MQPLSPAFHFLSQPSSAVAFKLRPAQEKPNVSAIKAEPVRLLGRPEKMEMPKEPKEHERVHRGPDMRFSLWRDAHIGYLPPLEGPATPGEEWRDAPKGVIPPLDLLA